LIQLILFYCPPNSFGSFFVFSASVVIDIEPMYEYIVVPYTEAKSISGAATLRTFCQHDFSLSRPNQLHILDSWTDITSGGSPQLTSSWRKNSQFLLKLAGVATIKVSLTLLEHGALQSTDSQFGFLLLETKGVYCFFFPLLDFANVHLILAHDR
jgi:hypothetical protein